MNLFSFVVLLTLLRFSQAYKKYQTETNLDYCILGNTPVCGTNGFENFRLDNECEFNNFNSKQLEKGQIVLTKTALENCYPSSTSPTMYGPSSYNTYCPQYCTKIFKPVCASYRNVQRNFTNECELKKHICDTKTNWQIILNGTCVAASCALDGQEVCASYNNYTQSFPNLLSLYADIQATGKNWLILNVGPCPCPSDYWPICAQLNCTAKTFQNECFLEREIKNGSYWSILFYGECPELPTIIGNTNNTINGTITGAINGTDTTAVNGTATGIVNGTTTGVVNGTSTNVANCNLSNMLYGPNKPVYIVRKNKIGPYISQQYRPHEKTSVQSYYPSYNPTTYSGSTYNPSRIPVTGRSYNPSYVPTSSPYDGSYKLSYAKAPLAYSGDSGPLHSSQGIYKSSNYASNPDYSPASSIPSIYNSDYKPIQNIYKSKSPSNSKYMSQYSSDYNPVSVKPSSCKAAQINYGGDSYDASSLLGSLYETFT